MKQKVVVSGNMCDKNCVKLLNFLLHLTLLSRIVLISEVSTENDFQCVHVTSENENQLKLNFVYEEFKVSKRKILLAGF